MIRKTLVCVNSLTEVDQSVYLTHCQMWYRMGKEFPEDKFILYVPRRTSIDNARNLAAKMALESECEYLFFVDDDVILHEKTFTSLLENAERETADAVMALTYIRSYPFKPMFFKASTANPDKIEGLLPYEDFQDHIDDNHLVRCDAIGCACVLFRVSSLSKLEAPYFVTLPNMTEDVYYCLKLNNTLGRSNTRIFVDCGVPTGHLGEKEVVSSASVEILKKHYEALAPESYPGTKLPFDRGAEYLEQVEEQLV